MGTLLSATAPQAALAATDQLTLLAGTNNSISLREYVWSGHGTASASNEIILQRCTAGTVATNLVPLNTVVSATTAAKSGVTQATTPTATTIMHRFGLNSNGALFRWVAAPGMAVEVAGAGQIGWRRSNSETSTVSGMAVVEQF